MSNECLNVSFRHLVKNLLEYNKKLISYDYII